MKNKIMRNFGLKILSVVAAIVLWTVVNSLNNPSITKTYYNIPVKLENTDLITGSGRVYEILDNTGVIPRVSIRAPQSIISELDEDNIIATADVGELSSLDTIKIDLETNAYQNQINSITGSIDTVRLNIENRKSRMLPLEVEIKGTVTDGYTVGNYTTDQNQVRISGAESLVNRISSAKAEVDVTGFTSDIRTNAEVRIYDSEGHAISSDSISQNIRNVGVSVSILQTKEVPVRFSYTGEAAQGYRGTGTVSSDRDTTLIYGQAGILKNIEEIVIPGDAINIDDQRNDYVTTVDIAGYLPGGVSLVNASDSVYTVSVDIEPETYKHIAIAASDITVTNIPQGFKVSLSMDEGAVLDVVGLETDLESLSRTTVQPTVDIEAWMAERGIEEVEEGFYGATVQFSLPQGVVAVDPVNVTLHIVQDD